MRRCRSLFFFAPVSGWSEYEELLSDIRAREDGIPYFPRVDRDIHRQRRESRASRRELTAPDRQPVISDKTPPPLGDLRIRFTWLGMGPKMRNR